MKTPKRIAAELVSTMEADNGVPQGGMAARLKDDKRVELFTLLEFGIAHMQKAGCKFTREEIDEMAMGEQEEAKQRFAKYTRYGYDIVDKALNSIFDPEREWVKHGEY